MMTRSISAICSIWREKRVPYPWALSGAYATNETLQLALTRLVQIIGEAARHVSPEGRAQLASVSWHRVVGMRHRLVHDYVNVDIAIVWQVVTQEVPPLIAALEAVVPPEPPE